MTITEFATIVFKSPLNFSDPTLQSLFQKLSVWQSECSGFPLRFFTNPNDPVEVHLVTGWASVAVHEAWIQGERNQTLLRIFAPYVDMPKIRMVHVGVDFEAIPKDTGCTAMVIERYDGAPSTSLEWESSDGSMLLWSLAGRDLSRDGDVYRFVGIAGDGEVEGVVEGVAPIARWLLNRAEPCA